MAGNPYVIRFSWRNMAAALVLAVALWLTPLAVWPTAPAAAKRVPRRPPVVRFLGAFQGVDRTAWSPVVFPLPTKYGFSGTADAAGGGHDMAALMKPRAFDGLFLETTEPPMEPRVLGALDGPEAPGGYRPSGLDERVFGDGARKSATGWFLDMEAALQQRGFRVDLAGAGMTPPAGLGGVDAYVELDPRGWPIHVLLDGTTGNPGVDRALVRALYAGRGERNGSGTAGKVRVFYRGSVGGRPGGESPDRANGDEGVGGRLQQGR